jgi:hypothetical protein
MKLNQGVKAPFDPLSGDDRTALKTYKRSNGGLTPFLYF